MTPQEDSPTITQTSEPAPLTVQARVSPAAHSRALAPGNGAPSPSSSKLRAPEKPRSRSGGSCCATTSEGGEGVGPAWLLLLLPLACCGGPLLIGVFAAAGAAAWGILGGVVALALGGLTLVLVRRRAARHRAVAAGAPGVVSRPGRQPIGGALR